MTTSGVHHASFNRPLHTLPHRNFRGGILDKIPDLKTFEELIKDGVETLSPKNFVPYVAMKMILAPPDKDLNFVAGVVLLAGAPLYETLRLLQGTASVVVGAAGTVVAGAAEGANEVGKKVFPLDKETIEEREKGLIDGFIDRMGLIVQESDLTIPEKNDLIDKPHLLVATSALLLAFASGEQEEGTLLVGDGQIMDKHQIRDFGGDFLGCFDAAVDLQKEIQALIKIEKCLNWSTFMKGLDNPSEEDRKIHDILLRIDSKANDLAKKIESDEKFIKAWEEKKSQFYSK